MAQYILKLAEGGTTELTNTDTTSTPAKKKKKKEVELFQYNGTDYSLRKYISDLEYNFESWLESRDIDDKYKPAIREAYRDMLNGYDKKELTPGLGNRSVDSTGVRHNVDGKVDPYGIAQTYFNTILQHQRPYEKPKKNTDAFDLSKTASKVNLIVFGTPNFSGTVRNSFLKRDDLVKGVRGTKNRVTDIYNGLTSFRQRVADGDEYEDLEDDERERYLKDIDNALAALKSDWRIDANEELALAKLGFNPEDLFFTGEKYDDAAKEETKEETAAKEEEKPKSELELAQDEYLQAVTADLVSALKTMTKWKNLPASKLSVNFPQYGGNYTDWVRGYNTNNPKFIQFRQATMDTYHDLFFNFIKKHNMFDLNLTWLKSKFNINNNAFGINKWYTWRDSNGRLTYSIKPNMSNGQVLLYLLLNFVIVHKARDKRNDLGNGRTLITIDANKGYALVFDEFNKKLYHEKIANLPLTVLQEALNTLFPGLVTTNKGGGVLKYYFGGTYLGESPEEVAERLASELRAEEQKLILATGKTPEQYAAAHRNLKDGFTGVDKARGAAIAMDLASVLASATGIGSVAGGGLGFAATLTELGADLADEGVSTSETVKNFLLGAGTSLLSFIPFVGGAGKAANITNKAIKWTRNAIKLVPTLAAAGVVFNDDILKTLKKVSQHGIEGISKGVYDNNDLRNIAMFIGALTGLTRQGIVSGKKAIIKGNAVKTEVQGGKYFVKTKNGQLEVDKPTYDRLNQAKTVEEANLILGRAADLGVIGRGSKWKLGFGDKKVFDPKNNLSTQAGAYLYTVDGSLLTPFGRFIFGSPDNHYSDLNYTLRYLNRPAWSFNWGFQERQAAPIAPRTTTPSGLMDLSFRHLNSGTKLVDLSRYRNPDGTLNSTGLNVLNRVAPGWQSRQFTTNGLGSYLGTKGVLYNATNGGVIYMPNNRLFYWKKGGKADFFANGNYPRILKIVKNASGGKIQKFLDGGIQKLQEGGWYSNSDFNVIRGNVTNPFLRIMNTGENTFLLRGSNLATNERNPNNTSYDPQGDARWLELLDWYKKWVNEVLAKNKDIATIWALQYISLHKDPKIAEKYRKAWFGGKSHEYKNYALAKNDLNFALFIKDVTTPGGLAFDTKGGPAHDILGITFRDFSGKLGYRLDLAQGWGLKGGIYYDPNLGVFVQDITLKKNRYRIKGTTTWLDDYETNPEKYARYKKGENPFERDVWDNDLLWDSYEIELDGNSEVIGDLLGNKEIQNKLNPLPSYLAEAGREALNLLGYGYNWAANEKTTKYLDKYKFPLENPDHRESFTYGDNEALMNAQRKMSLLGTMARNMAGTDQETNNLTLLLAFSNGMQYDEQARQVDTSNKKETAKVSLANAQYSTSSRIAAANKNLAQLINKNNHHWLLMAEHNRDKASQVNSLFNHVASLIENKKAQFDNQYLKDAEMIANEYIMDKQLQIQSDWDAHYQAMINNTDEKEKTAWINGGYAVDPKYLEYKRKMNELSLEKYNMGRKWENKLYGFPYNNIRTAFRPYIS